MENYTITALLLLFWAFLAIVPVLVQLRWGLWIALVVAGTNVGLLYFYGSMFIHGPPDAHMNEIVAIWYGLWATLIGGGLAVLVSLAKLGSGSHK